MSGMITSPQWVFSCLTVINITQPLARSIIKSSPISRHICLWKRMKKLDWKESTRSMFPSLITRKSYRIWRMGRKGNISMSDWQKKKKAVSEMFKAVDRKTCTITAKRKEEVVSKKKIERWRKGKQNHIFGSSAKSLNIHWQWLPQGHYQHPSMTCVMFLIGQEIKHGTKVITPQHFAR